MATLTSCSSTCILALCTGLVLSVACQPQNTKSSSRPPSDSADTPASYAPMNENDKALLEKASPHFKALPSEPTSPQNNPTTEAKVTLGQMLFYEPRLSKSGVISCNSCHNLATYGVDNRPTSLGHKSQEGARNSPTVLNADFHLAQFWDGRAENLEAQAEGPILNPKEMAMADEQSTLARLASMPEYVDAFQNAFPDTQPALTYKNMAKAIAAFERTLLTPSPFDAFLQGDGSALSTEAKEGLGLFIEHGCIACHFGTGVGGGTFQKFGVIYPYKNMKDLGRFEVSQKEVDKHVFRVPSLRNVERTYPYFHDGGVWDLGEAVKTMGKTQLGKELPDKDIAKIVAFLKSLTGEIPQAARTLPVLPASRKDTSQPAL